MRPWRATQHAMGAFCVTALARKSGHDLNPESLIRWLVATALLVGLSVTSIRTHSRWPSLVLLAILVAMALWGVPEERRRNRERRLAESEPPVGPQPGD